MSLNRKLKVSLLKLLPSALKRWVIRRRAPAMTAVLCGLHVKERPDVQLCDRTLLVVELEDGTQLIGEEALPRESLMYDWLVQEKGLSIKHVKVLLDVAARYLHPHMSVGYQRMKWPLAERRHFHPQHQNLAAEDQSLDGSVREELARVFKPQKGWAIIDVGSYFGHGALRIAREVGPSGKVLCVEAKELNVEVIREHIRRNGIEQMEVRYHAIWKEPGKTIDFHTTGRQANAIDAEVVDGKSVPVVTTSLPALIDDLGVVPSLVSLTVNGAEVEAIEGLNGMDPERLPERIMAPGWYLKEGEPRWKFMVPNLKALGYKVAVTHGGFVFGWRV